MKMAVLQNKIDFVMFFSVTGANPNGDPLNGNMPRTDYDGYGEVSDVCIKRKIRNRMQDMGYSLFVQSNDRIDDQKKSLEERFTSEFDSPKKDSDDKVYQASCEKWIDVRSFGQVMTFQKRSIGIRGPVSVSMAKSLSPVDVISMQITRSTNGMKAKDDKARSSDTMGAKYFVDYGLYMVKGSINPYFAKKTGFLEEDAEVIKKALCSLFVNDSSSARPEGSMEVKKLFWFTHPDKLGVASSAKIHRLVGAKELVPGSKASKYEDYSIQLNQQMLASLESKGLKAEEINGL